jgi:hypothetical protein
MFDSSHEPSRATTNDADHTEPESLHEPEAHDPEDEVKHHKNFERHRGLKRRAAVRRHH